MIWIRFSISTITLELIGKEQRSEVKTNGFLSLSVFMILLSYAVVILLSKKIKQN